MFEPKLIINWYAILTSVVAAFIFGFLWYGPLFGQTWGKLMGMGDIQKPTPQAMTKALVLQVLGLFLTSYVLTHSCQIWRASVWGLPYTDGPGYMYGFMCGFFTWLGYYVPQQLGKISWENRPWKLFFLNTTYDFIQLQIIGQILANWR